MEFKGQNGSHNFDLLIFRDKIQNGNPGFEAKYGLPYSLPYSKIEQDGTMQINPWVEYNRVR